MAEQLVYVIMAGNFCWHGCGWTSKLVDAKYYDTAEAAEGRIARGRQEEGTADRFSRWFSAQPERYMKWVEAA